MNKTRVGALYCPKVVQGCSSMLKEKRTAKSPGKWFIGIVCVVLLLGCCMWNNEGDRTEIRNGQSQFHAFLKGMPGHALPLEPWQRDTLREYILQPHRVAPEPTVREYNFEISRITTTLDGVSRELMVVNGQYPGPLIEAHEGDTLRVRVTNKDTEEGTSLHFHGLFMNGTNYLDGVVGTTQCAIGPGKSFTYEFELKQSGTYWYHAHSSMHYLKGLLGPLIIHRRPEAPRSAEDIADGEVVMLLTDLYRQSVDDLMLDFHEPWLGGEEPMPETFLVNGLTRPSMLLPKYATYPRVRVINAATYSVFELSADLPMTPIEMDGSLVDLPTRHGGERTTVYPGQRVSLLVHNTGARDFWLVAERNNTVYGDQDVAPGDHMRATNVLHADFEASPPSKVKRLSLLEAHVLSPPRYAQIELKYDLRMLRDAEGQIFGAFDTSPLVESMFHNGLADFIKAKGPGPKGLYPNKKGEEPDHHHHPNKKKYAGVPDKRHSHHGFAAAEPMVISDLSVVDLVISNLDDGPHPIHLHGHKFWVIEGGSLDTDHGNWWSSIPIKIDTTWIGVGEWIRLRFVADNPGIWLLHCHIPWHSVSGMATELLTLPDQLLEQQPSEEWHQLCRP